MFTSLQLVSQHSGNNKAVYGKIDAIVQYKILYLKPIYATNKPGTHFSQESLNTYQRKVVTA